MGTLENERRSRLEITGTVLLSITTLMVAWCTYQSTLWEGEQDFSLAKSNLYYQTGQQHALFAAQQREIDVAVTLSFMEAVIAGDKKRIDYFFRRGDARISPVLKEWLQTDPLNNKDAPPHPLSMAQYKSLSKLLLAPSDSAMSKAQQLWAQAQHANMVADKYTLFTVIFSIVMFLIAVATNLTRLRVARGFMIFDAVLFIIAMLLLIFLMPRAKIF